MKYFLRILFVLLVGFLGCSDDNNSDTNPFGPGSSASDVTFSVSIHQDQQHGAYFHFKPSVDVKIIHVVGVLNNQTYNIDGDPNSTMTTAEGFSVTVSNPKAGDKWTFTITGRIASNNNDFTSILNYSVPLEFVSSTNNVSFVIDLQQGAQGDIEFLFKPSVDVIITKVDVEMGGATDLVEGDATTVYQADTWYSIAGYNGVESGQKWTFVFTGKVSGSNQDYSVSADYTVP
ncbi:MAG: hypothetical protein OQJ81_02750 [Melioribacteraceae bacterium]|nr:hypothetical protein [Melioribacteraceae bacterium]